MEKQLKDYLHFYLGCEVEYFDYIANERFVGTLSGIADENYAFVKGDQHGIPFSDIKPILRPLTDMQHEEFRQVCNFLECSYYEDIQKKRLTKDDHSWVRWYIVRGGKEEIIANISNDKNAINVIQGNDYYRCYADLIPYLLSKHFDLFDFINSNLAIEKTNTI